MISTKIPPESTHTFINRNKIPKFQYPVISDEKFTLVMDSLTMDRLGRFQNRTVLSMGTAAAGKIFQDVSLGIAFSVRPQPDNWTRTLTFISSKHPYLMHTIQTVTAIHDRYINGQFESRSTLDEVYHLAQAAASFNQKLSGPIGSEDCDALWATAGLLSQIAFAFVDASKPEEAWPLAPPDPSDLDWITMSEKKMAIWHITNPLRPDSIFKPLAEYLAKNAKELCTALLPVMENLPPLFTKVYGLDNEAIADTCPYRETVNVLSGLLAMECNRETLLNFLSFASHMQPKFKPLLRQKDPRALLLLAYWYAKTMNTIWWIDRRATMECQAICIYLEKNYPQETDILELLQFPRERCGLGTWKYPVLQHISM
jgi:hypothetical protein